MDLLLSSFNGAGDLLNGKYANEWNGLNVALQQLRLHLKASDQEGKKGAPIFDPVGMNESIKQSLTPIGWQPNVQIPSDYKFLGTDVDFLKSGILVEVQFSNYPFLLNNLLRSELFFQNKQVFSSSIDVLILITKAHMFDSSNSTLYYEQAHEQLSALTHNNVFDIPIMLIGLSSPHGENIPCVWTEYHKPRYSRTVTAQQNVNANIQPGRGAASRSIIHI